jgi:hypothetical protein
METEPELVSPGQLVQLLSMIRGCRIVTVTAETVPPLNQRAEDGALCPWFDPSVPVDAVAGRRFRVRKRSVFSCGAVGKRRPGGLGAYASAVNRRRSAEWAELGELSAAAVFETAGRTWGRRRRGAPLVDYRGQIYLDIQRFRLLSVSYFDALSGSPILAADLQPWLRVRADVSGRQLLSRPVAWRDYRFDGLRLLTMDGQAFAVRRQRRRMAAAAESRASQIVRRRGLRAGGRAA